MPYITLLLNISLSPTATDIIFAKFSKVKIKQKNISPNDYDSILRK